jgi:hypothetical protein
MSALVPRLYCMSFQVRGYREGEMKIQPVFLLRVVQGGV